MICFSVCVPYMFPYMFPVLSAVFLARIISQELGILIMAGKNPGSQEMLFLLLLFVASCSSRSFVNFFKQGIVMVLIQAHMGQMWPRARESGATWRK